MLRRPAVHHLSPFLEQLESRQLLAAEIRLIYLVPSDKEYEPEYAAGIENSIRSLQRWYYEEMDEKKTFQLHDTIVETYTTSHPASYYGAPTGSTTEPLGFWDKVTSEGFALTGGKFNDPDNRWIFYIDADPSCGQLGGLGGSGVAMMPANDLRGLAGRPNIPQCPDDTPDTFGLDRWIGGTGHELGHALGLPHPPGCDDSNPETSCPGDDALMWTGYAHYPDTHLLEADKAILDNSPFLRSDVVPLPRINTPPRFTPGEDLVVSSFDGDQLFIRWATNITAGFGESDQTLTFQVQTDSPELFAVLPVIGTPGTLVFTPAPGASGVATITVTLHDNGGTADGGNDTSETFTRTITMLSDGLTVDVEAVSIPLDKVRRGKGAMTLAVLGSEEIDSSLLDLGSLQVGDVSRNPDNPVMLPVKAKFKDINGDGFKDVVVKVKTKKLLQANAIAAGTTQLTFRGLLQDSRSISGTVTLAASINGDSRTPAHRHPHSDETQLSFLDYLFSPTLLSPEDAGKDDCGCSVVPRMLRY